MLLRPFLNDAGSCASYLFGCTIARQARRRRPACRSRRRLSRRRRPRSGRRSWPCSRRTSRPTMSPGCRLWSSAPARPRTSLPARVSSSSTSPLADGDVVELGNTLVTALATPGHAPAHHAYAVADLRRGNDEPWLVFSGDSLLIGDVGRPDLHVADDARGQARLLHASLRRLLELPDYVVLYPSHYAGSVCGRGLSGNPVSSIGFERAHNPLLAARRPGRLRRCAARRHAAPAGRAGADRRRQPPGNGQRAGMNAPVRLGLRANARPVRAAGRAERARRRDGRPGAERAAARRQAGLRTALDLGDPGFRRRFRRREGAHEPRRGRPSRADRTQAAAGDRLARRAAGALLIGLAPSWWFIVAANLLLGVNQGLAWSMTVVMKIDLAGPRRRGLALGLNEAAGYLGVALAAFATGVLAASYAPRTVVWVGAALIITVGLLISIFAVRDTGAHVAHEQRAHGRRQARAAHLRGAFTHASLRDPVLRACNQAGLVNNLNDALAWGLAPLYLAAHGASVSEIAIVAAVYPLVWGAGQLATGWLSDHTGRKPLITAGMLVQAARSACSSPATALRAFARRGRATRCRHGDGLPDADRCCFRRQPAARPRPPRRRLPLLARLRLRPRRADRRFRRRRNLAASRDRDRRRSDRRERPGRRRNSLAATLTGRRTHAGHRLSLRTPA